MCLCGVAGLMGWAGCLLARFSLVFTRFVLGGGGHYINKATQLFVTSPPPTRNTIIGIHTAWPGSHRAGRPRRSQSAWAKGPSAAAPTGAAGWPSPVLFFWCFVGGWVGVVFSWTDGRQTLNKILATTKTTPSSSHQQQQRITSTPPPP